MQGWKSKKWWLGRVFGKLTVVDCPEEGAYLRSKQVKITCTCTCGNKKYITPERLTYGKATSCGACNYKPIEYWKSLGYPYQILFPSDAQGFHLNSGKTVNCICSCGTKFTSTIRRLTPELTCGKCDILPGKKLHIYTILGGTKHELKVKCNKCGAVSTKSYYNILKAIDSGNTTCVECNLKTKDWWLSQEFNGLTPIEAEDCNPGSHTVITVRCKCGNIFSTYTDYLYYNSIRCSKCRRNYGLWWKTKIKLTPTMELTSEFLEVYFRGHTLNLIEFKRNEKSTFKCNLCGKTFTTNFWDLYKLQRVDCGCLKYHNTISKGNQEIYDYVKSLGVKVLTEQKLKGTRLSLDVVCKTTHSVLVIEYNGVKWHTDKTQERDYRKYKLCLSRGYDYLCIYDDEWAYKNEICKNIIAYKLGKVSYKTIRPQKCKYALVESNIAHDFYDSYHIQGAVKAKYHLGAFYAGVLLAVMSIGRPSRQNSGDWEIKRMCARYDHKIHGVWSYILSRPAVRKQFKGKLVTFSDNRIFNGGVYGKMGMTLEYELNPDYYWVRGLRRFHKSALRKTEEERSSGWTELELRTAQGYHRTWDLGKKKWSLIIT